MENNSILDQDETFNKDFSDNATRTQRFLNYLIDLIIFCSIFYGIGYLLGFGSLVTKGYMATVYQYIGMVIYFTILEATTSKTIGKMITNTVVVDLEGNKIDFKKALLRSLCRLIPFEAFSFFNSNSSGWHDSITDTKVVQI